VGVKGGVVWKIKVKRGMPAQRKEAHLTLCRKGEGDVFTPFAHLPGIFAGEENDSPRSSVRKKE